MVKKPRASAEPKRPGGLTDLSAEAARDITGA